MDLHIFDLLIVSSYLLLCLYIGVSKSLKIKTLHDFASFKDITLPVLVCTLLSSSIGVGTTLGIAEKIYLFGLVFAIRQLLLPIYWLISAYVIAPKIEQFKDCLTISEVMNKLYGPSARWITSYASVLFAIGSLCMQITAMGYLFQYFFGIDQLYGSIISSAILVTYSVLGGMRAIIFSEVFKFTIFILIIPASCVVAMIKIGGIDNILTTLPTTHTEFTITKANFLSAISFMIYAILPSYNPELVQRYLLAKNHTQLKNAFRAAFGFSLIIAASVIFISYLVKSSGYSGNSAEVMLYFIQEYLPVGLKGLMIAGLLAIFMSCSESSVSATSIIIVNDILKLLFPKITSKQQLFLVRLAILSIIGITLVVTTPGNHLVDILWFARNFWDPIVFIPLTAGFLGFRTNANSFISSSICAVISSISAGIYFGEFAAISYCLGIFGSLIGFFSAHYIQIFTGHIITNKNKKLQRRVWAAAFSKIKFPNISKKLSTKQITKTKYNEFCIYIMISMFVYSSYFIFSQSNPIIGVVFLIGYFLALLFLFRDGLFSTTLINKYLRIYWYFLLTYCLPFTAGCLLFFSHGDDFWLLSGVLAIFALSFFVDSMRFLILNIAGISLAYILYHATTDVRFSGLISNVSCIYLFIFLGTLYFLRSREKENEQKIETLCVFSGAIAHEVKNPLASLNMSAQTLQTIISSSSIEASGDKVNLQLTIEEFRILKDVSKNLETITNNSVSTVDNILSSIRNHGVHEDKGIYKISEIIDLSLKDFNFAGSKVDINITDDFSFYGSLNNVKYLLLNLLNNVKDHAGLDVHISITAKENKLYFKDHGKGLTVEDTARIFNSFYTKSKSGTGIGLAFCKMVVEDMGGNIECNSEVGKYTEFVITFS